MHPDEPAGGDRLEAAGQRLAWALTAAEVSLKTVRAQYDFDRSKWSAGPASAVSLTALDVEAELVLDAPAFLDAGQLNAAAILALEARDRRVAALVCRAVRQGCTLRTLRGMEDLKAVVRLRRCSGTDRPPTRLTVAVEMC
ncbi:MAG: hypothetical protein LLG01_04595 [Planctomycetaceae bacterium]|nr:hypothetical protein [Planctomycetaceae bacterium]